MKCHLYASHFSRFANIFLRSRQFDDKCIAGFRTNISKLNFVSGRTGRMAGPASSMLVKLSLKSCYVLLEMSSNVIQKPRISLNFLHKAPKFYSKFANNFLVS